MKTIPIEEFKQWIMDQPDDRPVDMDEPRGSQDCCCVMAQFARDYLHASPNLINCGMKTFGANQDACLERSIWPFLEVTEEAKTFGEIKKHLDKL
jgi:hypothetical protein